MLEKIIHLINIIIPDNLFVTIDKFFEIDDI